MSKWQRQDEMVCVKGTVCSYYCTDENEAECIVRHHNADCDAYEARIAEMEAELARVKAESLRVVPVGEACELVEISRHQKFSMGDHLICEIVNPGQYDRTVDVRDLVAGEVFTSYRYAVNVQPVRLERWEEE